MQLTSVLGVLLLGFSNTWYVFATNERECDKCAEDKLCISELQGSSLNYICIDYNDQRLDPYIDDRPQILKFGSQCPKFACGSLDYCRNNDICFDATRGGFMICQGCSKRYDSDMHYEAHRVGPDCTWEWLGFKCNLQQAMVIDKEAGDAYSAVNANGNRGVKIEAGGHLYDFKHNNFEVIPEPAAQKGGMSSWFSRSNSRSSSTQDIIIKRSSFNPRCVDCNEDFKNVLNNFAVYKKGHFCIIK